MSSRWSRHVQKHEVMMSDEQLADFHLAERRLESLRRCVVHGRRFEALPDDLLAAQWVDAYRAVISNPDEPVLLHQLVTLQCELELRGIEPPRHLVTAQRAQFKEHVERLRHDSSPDPVAWARTLAELAVLRARLAEPKQQGAQEH